MEIRFCDICNESVPQSDLDAGRAVVRKDRVICAVCEGAMSHPGAEAPSPSAEATPAPSPAGPVLPPPGVGGVFAPPPPPAPPARGSAGVILAGLMGTVALLVTSVVTVVLVDRIRLAQSEDRAEDARLERAVGDEVARLEGVLERWREEDRALFHEELAQARSDAERAHARLDERLDAARGEIAGLRDVATRLDALESELRGGQAERRGFSTDLAQLKRDVGVLAERWAEALAMGDVAQAEPEPEERPPAWLEYTRGLESPNAATRWTAVTELGRAGDPGAVPYLVGMLSDPDIFVRMATARVLGDIGSDEAVPALIDALEDVELPVREAAVFSLRKITGQDFKFEPDASESERARRVKAWRDWWKKANKA